MSLQLSEASLIALLLAAVRAAAWLVITPPFNTRSVPGPVKALLSVAIALPIAPGLTAQVPRLAGGELVLAAAEQVVVGAALGFITSLFFAAIQAAGSIIDLFGGFSLAFAFDPFAMTGTSVFGRFYNIVATALLFATDAHAMILRGFTQSYRSLPLTGTLSLDTLSALLTGGLGQMFLAALQIAGPLVAVLFCTDVALGLLTRVAPALNVFALGFPIKILLTLGVAGAALTLLPRAFDGLMDRAVEAVLQLTGVG
jgi:flagellar biosynthetic protein FliR